MNELTTLRQRVIDLESCIERRENVMAEIRGDLVDAKNSEVVTWGELDSVQAENERLQARESELQEEIGHLEDSLIKQGQMLRDIVNITKGPPVEKMHSTHDAVESVARLKARVAEKCDAPVGWIDPDKYKAACESKMEFFKTIKELREQNEKLQARVAALELAALNAISFMPGGKAKAELRDAYDNATGSTEAFTLRKQAEALCACSEELKMSNRYEDPIFTRGMATAYGFITGTAQTLIDEAGQAGGQ